MKNKLKSLSITFFIFLIFIYSNIYASTNTEERTKDNLKIKESFENTDTVINAALNTPKVDETEKIYDFANLLTQSEEENLYLQISEYIEQNNMDMVVVTINSNNKSSAMEYADDFYDYNYFGYGDTYDGILLLIDMQNREVWISTTGKAISIYNDNRINTMLDYIQPKLTSGSYNLAVEEFINRADNYSKLGVEKYNYFEEYFSMALFIGTMITIILVIIGVMSHKNVKKANKAKYYLDKNSVILTENSDNFLHSNTTRVYVGSSSSDSSGGSSSHHSSSGSSHGGGGRGF